MLIPLVKSQIHPYANLWNNLVLNERFNHLKYKIKFYEQVFSQEEEKEWPSHRVFHTSNEKKTPKIGNPFWHEKQCIFTN